MQLPKRRYFIAIYKLKYVLSTVTSLIKLKYFFKENPTHWFIFQQFSRNFQVNFFLNNLHMQEIFSYEVEVGIAITKYFF